MSNGTTKKDLTDRADALGIDATGTKEELASRIAEEEARRGIETKDVVPAADAPAADPVEATAVPGDATTAPAPPDNPTDGRPPLAQVATDRAATTYVRVIGAKED